MGSRIDHLPVRHPSPGDEINTNIIRDLVREISGTGVVSGDGVQSNKDSGNESSDKTRAAKRKRFIAASLFVGVLYYAAVVSRSGNKSGDLAKMLIVSVLAGLVAYSVE